MVTSYSISQQQMLIENNIQNKLPLFLSALCLPLKINTFTKRFNDNRQQNEVYQCNNRRIEKSKCTILPLKPLSLWLYIYITFRRRRIVATIAFLRHLIPYHMTSIFRRGHRHVFFCFHSFVLCSSVLKPYFHLQNGKKFWYLCSIYCFKVI